ncbi:FAD-dependent oxidoreductase [Desulfonatronum parangueonense]
MSSSSQTTRSVWMDAPEVQEDRPLAEQPQKGVHVARFPKAEHQGEDIKASCETSFRIGRQSSKAQDAKSLTADTQTDVCVVGAGIAGMTTAYLLAREGKSVIVLDAGQIGGGMTQRTTAHLSNAIDGGYHQIERLHGEEGAKIAAQSHTAAIERIGQVSSEEAIDCDFERVDGYLFTSPGESKQELELELKAAHRAGLTGVELLQDSPPQGLRTGPCLRFPDQGQFHPLKYLAGLAKAIERFGGRIFLQTRVTDMKGGSSAYVRTDAGQTVSAASIVIATNSPINDIVTIHTKQAPYTTYVVAARIPRGSVQRALYWDTEDPYHYVRIHGVTGENGEHDLLIVGGEDHKTGQFDDGTQRHARLETWARERFPMLESVEFRWSGQVMESVDGIAFIGRNPSGFQNIYIATGDTGMGMTHGTIAGMLITDLVMERQNPWAKLYDPSRRTLRALNKWTEENLNVASRFVKDLSAGESMDVLEKIPVNEGAVLRQGLKKMAVYRDEQGTAHKLSARCTHLGCVVSWNSLEKSWDCPCHGSRYDSRGKVINGPANKDLTKMED